MSEPCRDGFFLDALAGGEGRGGRGVQDVVFAGKVHRELCPRDAVAIDFPNAFARLRGADCECASAAASEKP